MGNLLFISNIGGKKISLSFCGSSINASHRLGLNWFHAINKSLSTPEQVLKEDAELNIKQYNIDVARNPLSPSNIRAYRQIKDIIKKEKIDYIHCNTPTGGMLGRLAGARCGVKKIIYQVHGYFFYKGAPKKRWLIYYPVERFLAHFTDAVIVINTEDYEMAKKMPLRKNGSVFYVPGVGVNTSTFVKNEEIRLKKRQELNLKPDDIMLIFAGELNTNKNNITLLKAIAGLKQNNVHLFLCGVGGKEAELKAFAEDNKIGDNVHFLGFRDDVLELYSAADAFVFASLREGLPRSIMEAMSMGLPCIVSDIRGNRDLIENGVQGFLCDPNKPAEYTAAIEMLASNEAMRNEMSASAIKKIKNFDIAVVENELEKIYRTVFELRN